MASKEKQQAKAELKNAKRARKAEEKRDKKMYGKAIKEFTGISSPYEAPDTPELKIDTGAQDLAQSVEVVIKALQDKGVIPAA